MKGEEFKKSLQINTEENMNTTTIKKEIKHFFAHYCLDCQMMYFGKELNVIKPCVRCGSKNVLNGPLMNSKEKSAALLINNE